jgi:predicted Fe-Mo cluster-binding NifX family protein
MRNGRIAVPSNGNGGLEATRSGHFGHCDVFTIIDVENGASHNVKALVVGGIGMRPLMGFKQAGIDVYHDSNRPEIKPVVEDLIAGRLPKITDDQVCGGGGG